MKKLLTAALLLSLLTPACQQQAGSPKGSAANAPQTAAGSDKAHRGNPYYSRTDTTPVNISDAEWKRVLPADVYAVARGKETERAFTGKYVNSNDKGTYRCAACGNALFRSTAKFASGCGWPSFYEGLRPGAVKYEGDSSHDMERTEVLCGRCGAHLGHIFDDGPPPTGKRYCMNSVALDFEADSK